MDTSTDDVQPMELESQSTELGLVDQESINTSDEELVQAPTSQRFSLSLLQTIRTAQSQNGLKHGDYSRYRRHCRSRLQALYKLLKMQHGRTKYQKRKMDVHSVTNQQHLLVPLFSAERAWGYAMEIKKSLEGVAPDARKRRHLLARIRKAAYWAAELARFAVDKCDSRSSIEAEAYSSWLQGSLMMEKEADWELALGKFTRAKKLFSELGQVCDLEQQNLCTAQVEEMEPAIRYCIYQIGRQGGTAPGVDALLRLGELDGRGTTEELQAQLSELAQESQAAAEASSVSIEWAGVRHTARHEKVKAALLQAQQYAADLDAATSAAAAAASSSTTSPMDSTLASEEAAATSTLGTAPAASAAVVPSAVDVRVSLYDRMIASYADAKAQLRAVQTSLLGGDEDPQAAELASLEAAITATSLQRVIDRTTLLVADTEKRFGAALDATATGKRLKDKGQFSKAEEVVRLYDTLCRNYEDLGDLGARQGGRQGEELYALCAARVAAAQALRCYYIAHAYLGSDKALEAHALFVRAGERAASGQERLQEVGLPFEGIARLAIQAAAYRTVALTELLAESVRAREAVEAGVGGIALSDPQQTGSSGGAADTSAASGKAAAAKPARYLSEHMDAWESFAGAAGGKGACIYNAPYSIQAIPVRPIMLDTASNYITYPSLEHRMRKAEKKGIMASLFGTWGAARS